jgi:hypothetical protein
VLLLAVIVNNGSVPPPVPVSETVKVGFAGTVAIVRLADRAPVELGVNARPMTQFAPAIAVPAHESATTANSPMGEIAVVYVNAVVPVLDSVAVRAGVLVAPTAQVPKASAAGDTPAAVPPKDTVLDQVEVTTPLVQ